MREANAYIYLKRENKERGNLVPNISLCRNAKNKNNNASVKAFYSIVCLDI